MTRRYATRLSLVAGLAALAGTLALPAALPAADAWSVPEATIRFRLSLGLSPTHKTAGYFVQLPDGGLLPGTAPQPQAMTAAGQPLATYTLWHNKSSGMAIVFEQPGVSGDVTVYVSAGDKLKLWTPQSSLTPSAIVCTQPGVSSMEAAKNLARMGPVGPSIHYQNSPGIPRSPLSLQGDQSGRPPPSSFYMLSYVDALDPGATWIAPFYLQGNSEVRVDDKPISPAKKIDKWGGTGQTVDLAKGLHKVEIFSACDASVNYAADGIVWFTWKPPHATAEDLGGIRSTNVPLSGTPKFESRLLRGNEIVKSGDARIQQITLRDGGPAACFTTEGRDVFWFGNEEPSIVYSFTALAAGNPTNTVYTWSFGDKSKPTGPKVMWFLTGLKEQSVSLTASTSNKSSTVTVPVFAYSTVKSSLDSPSTRENFRQTCLSMIRAYPTNADPTVSWDKSMWDTFFQVQELGKGGQLLAEVLVNRSQFFTPRIPPEKHTDLQDIFFHSVSYIQPDTAMDWLKGQEKLTKDIGRRNELKIMQAEIFMYYKKNPDGKHLDEARKILQPISSQGASAGDSAAMATIRLGDIAFLKKDLNEANRNWGSVAKNVKLTDDVLKGEESVQWRETEEEKKKPAAPEAPPEKESKVKKAAELKSLKGTSKARGPRVDDWKKSAVLDTSMAASITTLIDQGSYLDAMHELQKWERNFPMSKISSDYFIQEARFYITIGNRARARAVLEAYLDNVDASSYLVDAAELLLRCMVEDKESDEVLAKFCDKMKKRFEFHPFADRVNGLLRQIRAGGVKMDAPPIEGI